MKKNAGLTAKHSKKTQYNEGDVLTFGKYKGRSVIEVLVSDPQYIIWVNNNVHNVIFKEETINRAIVKAKQKEDEFYRRRKLEKYEDEPLVSNILGL